MHIRLQGGKNALAKYKVRFSGPGGSPRTCISNRLLGDADMLVQDILENCSCNPSGEVVMCLHKMVSMSETEYLLFLGNGGQDLMRKTALGSAYLGLHLNYITTGQFE